MADWDQIAKSLSEAGKTAAMGLVDRNRMKVEDFYQKAQEQRANEIEQIRFERNRAAEMADRQKLMKEEAEITERFAKIRHDDEADLTNWLESPDLHEHADNLKMKADTFADEGARKELDGLGRLVGAIKEGKLEKELDEDMSTALKNLPPSMSTNLRATIGENYKKKLLNNQAEQMYRYYEWMMKDKDKELEWSRLTFDQIMKMRADREGLYTLIGEIEKDEKYLIGRQKAIEFGINPLDDPKNFPQWNELISNPKNKNASILMGYEERWKRIAGLKGLLLEMNEGLYRRDPMGTDPERYLRDLSAAENRKAGVFPLPPNDPKRQAMIESVVPKAEPAKGPSGAAHKLFVDTVYEKGIKSLFLNIREGIQHDDEFEKFKKQMKSTYGDTVNPKDVKLLVNRGGLIAAGKETIGTIFYDPHTKMLVEVVADPMDPSKIGLVPLQPIGK